MTAVAYQLATGACRWCGRTMHEVAAVAGAVVCVSEPAPHHSVEGYARVADAAGRDRLVKVSAVLGAGGAPIPGQYRVRVGAEPPVNYGDGTAGGRFRAGSLRPHLPLWWVEGGHRVNVVLVAGWSALHGPRKHAGAVVLPVPGRPFGVTVTAHPLGRAHEAVDLGAASHSPAAVARALAEAARLWG